MFTFSLYTNKYINRNVTIAKYICMCFCEYFFLMLSFIAYLNGLFILKRKTIEICQRVCVYACINNDDNNGNIDVLVGVTTIDDCWIYKFYYSCRVFQFFYQISFFLNFCYFFFLSKTLIIYLQHLVEIIIYLLRQEEIKKIFYYIYRLKRFSVTYKQKNQTFKKGFQQKYILFSKLQNIEHKN